MYENDLAWILVGRGQFFDAWEDQQRVTYLAFARERWLNGGENSLILSGPGPVGMLVELCAQSMAGSGRRWVKLAAIPKVNSGNSSSQWQRPGVPAFRT